jgi:hypothetical protein
VATTIFTAALNVDDSGNAGLSVRQVVAITGASQGQVRVTFQAAVGSALVVDHCSIGVESTVYNTVATPVELLFTGAHGFNLTAGGTIVSDWANFSCLTTDHLVLVFDCNATGPAGWRELASVTGATLYYLTATASYNQATPAGSWSNLASTVGAVSLIETQSAGLIDIGWASGARGPFRQYPRRTRPGRHLFDRSFAGDAAATLTINASQGTAAAVAIAAASTLTINASQGTAAAVAIAAAVSIIPTVVLLLHCDGAGGSTSFPDTSGRGHTVTPSGAAQVSTAQSVFGGASARFSSSSDDLALDGSSDFSFGTGDFTIEQWVRFDTLAEYIVADWAPGPQIRVKSDGHVVYAIGGVDCITSAAALSVNTQYHIAAVRAGGTTQLFIGGVAEATTYVASDAITAGANRPIFGGLVVPSGATHLWPMTNAQVSGTTIIDTIGGLNGTAGSSVTSTSGPPGGSTARLIGNDANSYVTLSTAPFSDFTQAFTIAFWYKPTDITQHPYDSATSTPSLFSFTDAIATVLINLRPGNSSSNWATANTTPFDGMEFFSIIGGSPPSGYPLGVPGVQVSGQWVHFTLTQQAGPSAVAVYVNGVVVASPATVANRASAVVAFPAAIGCSDAPSGVSTRPVNAAMAQFTIYPRALSASEVAQLYAALR